jgi:hypothetical protein
MRCESISIFDIRERNINLNKIGSLSHRRPDFIDVFSAGDDEPYALIGGLAMTFDIAVQ